MNQSELEANACSRHQARAHWLKKWASFVNHSLSAGKQNQSNYQITFDTQLKTAIL